MHDQCLNARHIITQQEQNKTRLRGELDGARSELSQLRSELEEAKKKLAMTNNVFEELEVAKELLVTYSSDLQSTIEAHSESLNLVFRNCDQQYKNSALELQSFNKLMADEFRLHYRGRNRNRSLEHELGKKILIGTLIVIFQMNMLGGENYKNTKMTI